MLRSSLSVAAFTALLLSILLYPLRAIAEGGAPPPPPPPAPWYEALRLSAFADAYASVNYNFPKPQTGQNTFRAHDTSNGFAISWVGADVGYDPDPVGGNLALRFGPTAQTYNSRCPSTDALLNPCDANIGLALVKEAYASFRPGGPEGRFQVDFGKFETIFATEVAESQRNPNYTRGLLYSLAEPWFHTGLRAELELMPELSLTAIAVNGYNNSVDNNLGKTFGLQAHAKPTYWLSAKLGWLGGPEQDDQTSVSCTAGYSYDASLGACTADPTALLARDYPVERGAANQLNAWRHLVNLVIRLNPVETFELLAGGGYGWEGARVASSSQTVTMRWYGALLSARYQLTPAWAL
ncbi:MAG TPA: outer membrane beta-barrel protein, partial [Polyangiaceae bacterium]